MQNFVFENPTKIVFGNGQIPKIGKEISRFGHKALLVYGMSSIRHLRNKDEWMNGKETPPIVQAENHDLSNSQIIRKNKTDGHNDESDWGFRGKPAANTSQK